MKATSLPNLNRETTSFPNFFTLYQDVDHDDHMTLNDRPNIDHGDDTEASETSPFNDILSLSPLFRRESTIPTSSVGSKQFSGESRARSEGTSPAQLWRDRNNHPDFPEHELRRAFNMSCCIYENVFHCRRSNPKLSGSSFKAIMSPSQCYVAPDPETDELYAQMTLQPVPSFDNDALLRSDLSMKINKPQTEVFCKTLTASDTSIHGGCSVPLPRRVAEKFFPPLDYTLQGPAQELVARDLHDNLWTFCHIYRVGE